MDTHIDRISTDASDTPHLIAARLPGEPEHKPVINAFGVDDAPLEPERAQALTARPINRRTKLVVGAALGVITAAAASIFLIWPYNRLYPVPGLTPAVHQMAAKAGENLPALVAPSASLANVNVSPPPPAIRTPYTPRAKSDQMAEIRSLGAVETVGRPNVAVVTPKASAPPASPFSAPPMTHGQRAAATPADQPALPAGSTAVEPDAPIAAALATAPIVAGPSATIQSPLEPGSALPAAHPPSPHDVTTAVLAAISITPTARAAIPPTTGPTNPPSAVTVAVASPAQLPSPPVLAAATPTPPVGDTMQSTPTASSATQTVIQEPHTGRERPKDLTEMANMVTLLSTMVRNLEIQQAQLQALVKKSAGATAAQLDDFGQRLALSEAHRAMAAAQEVGAPAPADDPTTPPTPSQSPVILTGASAAVPSGVSTQTGRGATRYHVQAASPGLALLAEIERGGGDGAQIQVVVGDTIPGYGRVKDISQRGTIWSVTTENGSIQ